MAINPETKITVRVNKTNGLLNPTSQFTLRNQFREYQINSLEDIPNVDPVNVVTGSTLVFNQAVSKYEIKPLDANFLIGVIDCGTF
jgi:hypothetical protein